MISISWDVEVVRAEKYSCQGEIFGGLHAYWCACVTNDIDIFGGTTLAAEYADQLLVYDIGGSHITAGLCLLEPMTLLKMAVAPLPDDITGEAFIGLLDELAGRFSDGGALPAGASFAFPAPFDYGTGTSRMVHKLKNLYGVSLRDVLAERRAWLPEQISFLNDADAALLGEACTGAATGASRAAGIMLGTGIGFAFFVEGNLDAGAQGIPPDNEIWNLPFQGGIVEDLLSSRAIQQDYAARTGERQSVETIALRSATDADAREVFEVFGRNLGQAIRQYIEPLHPEVIVFGGGISRSSHLFLPAARNELNNLKIELVPSVLFEKAPLLGAAMHWRKSVARPVHSHSV
jgi:glucokinase